MTAAVLRRLALISIAAPLALGLAACGKKDAEGGAVSGAPIAVVAPPAGKAWSDIVARTPEGGYRMGNPEAPIKLIEYGSLTCSHCAEFAEKGTAELRDTFVASGRVSYEFRNFVRDPIDLSAALLTRCGAPESFFPLTEQVFAAQHDIIGKVQAAGDGVLQAAGNQPPEKRGIAIAQVAGLDEFFAARGLAKDQANACLADTTTASALAAAVQADGDKYEISGTPTFLINGDKVEANTWEKIKAQLETMGAR